MENGEAQDHAFALQLQARFDSLRNSTRRNARSMRRKSTKAEATVSTSLRETRKRNYSRMAGHKQRGETRKANIITISSDDSDNGSNMNNENNQKSHVKSDKQEIEDPEFESECSDEPAKKKARLQSKNGNGSNKNSSSIDNKKMSNKKHQRLDLSILSDGSDDKGTSEEVRRRIYIRSSASDDDSDNSNGNNNNNINNSDSESGSDSDTDFDINSDDEMQNKEKKWDDGVSILRMIENGYENTNESENKNKDKSENVINAIDLVSPERLVVQVAEMEQRQGIEHRLRSPTEETFSTSMLDVDKIQGEKEKEEEKEKEKASITGFNDKEKEKEEEDDDDDSLTINTSVSTLTSVASVATLNGECNVKSNCNSNLNDVNSIRSMSNGSSDRSVISVVSIMSDSSGISSSNESLNESSSIYFDCLQSLVDICPVPAYGYKAWTSKELKQIIGDSVDNIFNDLPTQRLCKCSGQWQNKDRCTIDHSGKSQSWDNLYNLTILYHGRADMSNMIQSQQSFEKIKEKQKAHFDDFVEYLTSRYELAMNDDNDNDNDNSGKTDLMLEWPLIANVFGFSIDLVKRVTIQMQVLKQNKNMIIDCNQHQDLWKFCDFRMKFLNFIWNNLNNINSKLNDEQVRIGQIMHDLFDESYKMYHKMRHGIDNAIFSGKNKTKQLLIEEGIKYYNRIPDSNNNKKKTISRARINHNPASSIANMTIKTIDPDKQANRSVPVISLDDSNDLHSNSDSNSLPVKNRYQLSNNSNENKTIISIDSSDSSNDSSSEGSVCVIPRSEQKLAKKTEQENESKAESNLANNCKKMVPKRRKCEIRTKTKSSMNDDSNGNDNLNLSPSHTMTRMRRKRYGTARKSNFAGFCLASKSKNKNRKKNNNINRNLLLMQTEEKIEIHNNAQEIERHLNERNKTNVKRLIEMMRVSNLVLHKECMIEQYRQSEEERKLYEFLFDDELQSHICRQYPIVIPDNKEKIDRTSIYIDFAIPSDYKGRLQDWRPPKFNFITTCYNRIITIDDSDSDSESENSNGNNDNDNDNSNCNNSNCNKNRNKNKNKNKNKNSISNGSVCKCISTDVWDHDRYNQLKHDIECVKKEIKRLKKLQKKSKNRNRTKQKNKNKNKNNSKNESKCKNKTDELDTMTDMNQQLSIAVMKKKKMVTQLLSRHESARFGKTCVECVCMSSMAVVEDRHESDNEMCTTNSSSNSNCNSNSNSNSNSCSNSKRKKAFVSYLRGDGVYNPKYSNRLDTRRGGFIDSSGTPSLIIECNDNCQCAIKNEKHLCCNRVVQNHRYKNEAVKMNKMKLICKKYSKKGWGVVTLKEIQQGTFIGEYCGEYIDDYEAEQREDDSYLWTQQYRPYSDYDGATIDAKHYGNITRFINHCCTPNLFTVEVLTQSRQAGKNLVIGFFALRHIKAGEELTINYSYQAVCNADSGARACFCGSQMCQGRMR